MREIVFYRTASGRSPVHDFLDEISPEAAEKVVDALTSLEVLDPIPYDVAKKLAGTDALWEIRVRHRGNAFRILCFWESGRIIILLSAFAKKTERTPMLEIEVAQRRRRDYLRRKEENG